MTLSRLILVTLILQPVCLSVVEAGSVSTTSVQSIRYSASADHTRILIDLNSNARFESAKLTGPARVYFDISNSKLSSSFSNNAPAAGDRFVKQLRVAQNRPDVVRVVLNLSESTTYAVSELNDPFCIVVDLHSSTGGKAVYEAPAVSVGPDRDVGVAKSAPGPATSGNPVVPKPSISPASAHSTHNSGTSSEADTESPQYPALLAEQIDTPVEVRRFIPPTPILPDKDISASEESTVGMRTLPLTIDGTLSTGYYRSFTRGGGNANQNIGFMPAVANLNIKGYYLKPDFVDYSVQTELNTGSQASDAGFIGGNGVHFNVTTFRKGAFPVTFNYSNVQLKDAYFGSLTQISSYTLNNRNTDVGLTAGIRLAGLPNATVSWGGNSVKSQSYNPAVPDYVSRSNHLNLNCGDQRWGWEFQCFVGRQRQTSDLFMPQSQSASPLRQDVTQYRGSARRSFGGDLDLYIDAGSQNTANFVFDRPIDLSTRYINANLRLFQRKRWKTSLRAGYSSNIASLLLTQLVGGLGNNGSVSPGESILQPFERKTSYFNFTGLSSLDISHGLSLYGSADRTAVFTGNSLLDSSYFTTSGGVNYARTFRWGNVSGQYGRTLGGGNITGQTGRVMGQSYAITVQPGNPDGLIFDITVRGTSQSIRSEIPAREHSFSTEGGVGIPLLGQYRARIGGGLQTGVFTNQGNEFRSRGYTARIGFEHPRFQLNGSLNSNIGNSLQSYGQALNGLGLESTFLSPLRLVPSDLRAYTVALHVIPIRKLEFSALFTRSVQHLEGIVANDFQVVDIYATYHFRKLQFVVGYFNSSQIYSSFIATYPETQRGRFYIRISRPVKFL